MRIEIDDLSRDAVRALLTEHLADMHATSPADSVHALDVTGLMDSSVTMWTLWSEGDEYSVASHSRNGRRPAARSSRCERHRQQGGVAWERDFFNTSWTSRDNEVTGNSNWRPVRKSSSIQLAGCTRNSGSCPVHRSGTTAKTRTAHSSFSPCEQLARYSILAVMRRTALSESMIAVSSTSRSVVHGS